MKIINLQAENVKRLKAVQIKPDGSLVKIGGRNAQGKSSILDSIEYALGGKPKVDRPIRDGERTARVILETEDLIVTRKFSSSGSQLTVENRSGRKFSSPQAMLDKLYGSLTFDPLEFSRKRPKEQAEALRGLVGIDLSELDQARAEAYEERTFLNREIKSIESQIESMPVEDVDPVSVADLTEELQRRIHHNRTGETIEQDYEKANLELDSLTEKAKDIQARIEELQRNLLEIESNRAKVSEEIQEIKNHRDTFSRLDTEEIRKQIEDAEETNRKAAQAERRKELLKKEKETVAKADKLTDQITEIDQEKRDTLADADFPLDGLAFDEGGVVMNGIPFEQCSSAEQLRISVAMGFAMNPELRVLLVREGSLLDSDSLEVMRELADKYDGQLWIEQVSETGEGCTVMIEDGQIKGKAE